MTWLSLARLLPSLLSALTKIEYCRLTYKAKARGLKPLLRDYLVNQGLPREVAEYFAEMYVEDIGEVLPTLTELSLKALAALEESL